MLDKCHVVATEISELEVLNSTSIDNIIESLVSIQGSRLVIADHTGLVLYDSDSYIELQKQYFLVPEVVQALDGNDVFSWYYHEGTMVSYAASPIVAFGTTIGCVYIMESDIAQGGLIQTLQKNTLIITIILELVVILYSLTFSTAFTRKLRKIMASMRIIREGDYTHKVKLAGRDELAVLGSEFNDLTERLNTSEQKRRQFVSDASHELKTPLASIKLLTDSILQNDMDMETVREFVSDIGNEADRLNRMSQKLLSLSKVESQADSDCEIVYLAPTIERAARMLSAIAKENQIHIQLDLEDDCPILILEDVLYQIIFNLLENGIKYNTPGGTLTVQLQRDHDNVIVRVCDTGVGIPEEALEHIFERFYRVDKARSRKSGGSGLGLSIVRIIVQRNRGEISVESQLGKGTTFTLQFPAFDMEDES